MKRRSSTDSDKVLFSKDCIFCNKEGRKWKKVSGKIVSENTAMFDMGGGRTVLMYVEKRNDAKLLTRIRGVCLFSVEAQYHPSCREEYTRQAGVGRSECSERRNIQFELKQAHKRAFEIVCSLIEEMIFNKQKIMKLGDLCKYYTCFLAETQFAHE